MNPQRAGHFLLDVQADSGPSHPAPDSDIRARRRPAVTEYSTDRSAVIAEQRQPHRAGMAGDLVAMLDLADQLLLRPLQRLVRHLRQIEGAGSQVRYDTTRPRAWR